MATEKKQVDEPAEEVAKGSEAPNSSARPNDTPIVEPQPLPQHLRNSTFAQRAKKAGTNKRVESGDGKNA